MKYSITGWRFHNTVLDYNCPCQKDVGFFFLPVAVASELIGTGKCSEMDVVLDLWLSAIYNDERVQGSDVGPVVYLRNGTGNPLVSYAELAQRWGMSKATVSAASSSTLERKANLCNACNRVAIASTSVFAGNSKTAAPNRM